MKKLNFRFLEIIHTVNVLICASALFFYTDTAQGQTTEFAIHDNGLIYDENTMTKLGHIVDSLNLRFKTCEARNYESLPQGFATIVIVKGHNREVKQAINNGVSPEELLRRFPRIKHRREWIVKFHYRDYTDKQIVEYTTLPLPDIDRIRIALPDRGANDIATGWVFDEGDGELTALYLRGVESRRIPDGYAQLIQYVDCMVDTTGEIYLSTNKGRMAGQLSPQSKIAQYLKFADDFDGEPVLPTIDSDSPFARAQYDKFNREHQQWDNERMEWLDQKMSASHYHKSLLIEAVNEAMENHTGDGMLEFYAERYLSAEQALAMKRLRKPVGFCSMDQTPRLHAQSICRLAAETTHWDIFLRAHLDIMNDNFERNSDGSYAWAGRGTYLKEIEELDINALDLLIGTALRAVNVSDNHYFGDIGRVGRALSETVSPDELEDRLLTMIADENLDLYNRLLMAYVFDHYNYNLQDNHRKKNNTTRFLGAVATLPNQLGNSFNRK